MVRRPTKGQLEGRCPRYKLNAHVARMRTGTLPEPTANTQELWQVADEMLVHRLPAEHFPVQLLGMGVGSIDSRGMAQGLLFDRQDRKKSGLLRSLTRLDAARQ